MNAAKRILDIVNSLPEQRVAEVLSFVEALQTKQNEEYEQAKKQALAMLKDPPLILSGRYWSRDSLYDRF